MALKLRIDEGIATVERTAAFALNQTAAKAVAVLREKLNVRYPPASRPKQWPRKRTGNLRNSVRWEPGKKKGRNYSVIVHYDDEGFYGYILEEKGRKGPKDIFTLAEVRAVFDKSIRKKKR